MSRQIDVKALVSHIVRGDGADKCRICMGDTSEGQVHLGDTVMLDGDTPVTLAELLETITGVEVEHSSLLSSRICSPCATSAKHAAPFLITCKNSIKTWKRIVNYLDNIHLIDNMKSLYIVINDEGLKTVSNASKSRARPNNKCLLALRTLKKQCRREFKKSTATATSATVKCPTCEKEFLYRYKFNQHIRLTKMRVCAYCGDILNVEKLKDHIKTHGETSYTCEICSESYVNKTSLDTHMRKNHSKGAYHCIECKKAFKNHSNLVYHLTRHREKTCAGCNKTFTNIACFQYHTKNCSNSKAMESKFICDYCSNEYTIKSALKTHIINTHLVGWTFQCEHCGKKFPNIFRLREHDNIHNKVFDRFTCSICQATMSTRRGIERHYKKHFTVGIRGRRRTLQNRHIDIRIRDA